MNMAEFVKLNPQELKFLHEQNPDLVSYNVEFAEVTGGTFWKAYTPEQMPVPSPSSSVPPLTASLLCTAT